MGIYVMASGDIECDTCHKIIGKLKYADRDGGFLEKLVTVTCNDCLPKPNATLGNLEGDTGSSHMQGTPKAQGHEADKCSEVANHV